MISYDDSHAPPAPVVEAEIGSLVRLDGPGLMFAMDAREKDG